MKSSTDHIARDLVVYGLQGQTIIVGVSGGRDSMLLLHYLKQLPLKLIVAHVNYRLRAEDSDADEFLVRAFCSKHQLQIEVYHVAPEELDNTSIQEQARKIRYTFFDTLRQNHEAIGVAIAHHQDDQLETILFQFLRGGGLASMRGMQRYLAGIWRPLLHMNREQINEQIELHQIQFRDDATNYTNHYTRNRLRHNVVPELDACVPQWRGSLLQRAEILQEVEAFLQANMGDQDKWLTSLPNGEFRLDISVLLSEPLPQYRLWSWAVQLGLPATTAATILHLWQSKTGASKELKTWRFYKERAGVRLVPITIQDGEVKHLELADLPCEIGDWYVDLADYNKERDRLSATSIVMKLDAIQWPLQIRPSQMEDEIQPFGMSGHKRVARLLIQKKVEQHDKQHVRVWAHGHRVYWVEGLVLSELCRAEDGDRVLMIRKNHDD
ncbi:MAG: tRNA lysidine(34) synthetase TilS [Bacteroidota bacterium]